MGRVIAIEKITSLNLDGWYRRHSDNRSASNSDTGPTGSVSQLWSTTADITHFSVVDNTIYASEGDQIVARDVSGGSIEWSKTLPDTVSRHLTVGNGLVYTGTFGSDGVFACDAGDGSIVWGDATYALEQRTAPVLQYGSVYYCGGDSVRAYNPNDGTILWTESTSFTSTLSLAGNRLYLGTSGSVICRDADGGAQQWTYSIPDTPDGGLAVDGTTVFGVSQQTLFAVDRETGSEEWRVSLPIDNYYGVALSDDALFYSRGGFNALEIISRAKSDGSENWRYTVSGNEINSPPVYADGYVYGVETDGGVFAIDAATGNEDWSITNTARGNTQPVVAGGVVLVNTANDLIALG